MYLIYSHIHRYIHSYRPIYTLYTPVVAGSCCAKFAIRQAFTITRENGRSNSQQCVISHPLTWIGGYTNVRTNLSKHNKCLGAKITNCFYSWCSAAWALLRKPFKLKLKRVKTIGCFPGYSFYSACPKSIVNKILQTRMKKKWSLKAHVYPQK